MFYTPPFMQNCSPLLFVFLSFATYESNFEKEFNVDASKYDANKALKLYYYQSTSRNTHMQIITFAILYIRYENLDLVLHIRVKVDNSITSYIFIFSTIPIK